MKGTIGKVFIIIGILVLGLILWLVFFSDGGVLQTGWNSVVAPINNTWQKITGDKSSTLVPTFDDAYDGGYDGSEGLGDTGW